MAKQNDATHVKGIKSGNSTGNYERDGRPQARRHVDAGALDGHQRRRARADRPADAEPVARVVVELGFSVDGAARVEHAAVPTLRFALRRGVGGAGALGAARRAAPDRRAPARVRRGRARPAVRALRAGRGLGHDAAHAAVDAHDAGRAGVRGLDGGRPRRAVLATTSRSRPRATSTRCRDGDVPLEFLFSGSVFYTGADGGLQTTRLSWQSEAEYALPVRVWKETMERYFRGTAWVRLRKESFDRLSAYKSRNALASWDDALEALGL